MYQLTVSYSTQEELLAAVMALGGETVAQTPLGAALDRVEASVGVAKGKPGRKPASEKKAEAAAATAAGFQSPAAPTPVAKKHTVDDLKLAIRTAAKGDTARITEFVSSLGVEKISDLAQAQLDEVFEQGQVDAFFNAPVAVEIDPMS